MLSSMRIDQSLFGQNWKKFLLWGIVLVLLGLLAMSATLYTTLITVVFIGMIILIAGVVILIDAFTFWRMRMGGFILHLLMGILYIVVGAALIWDPLKGSVSLTLMLGVFYLLLGFFRMIYAVSHRLPKWGWGLFNALISFALGILILASWPASSLYIIGLFIGIDLLFSGWVYIMGAFAGRAMMK